MRDKVAAASFSDVGFLTLLEKPCLCIIIYLLWTRVNLHNTCDVYTPTLAVYLDVDWDIQVAGCIVLWASKAQNLALHPSELLLCMKLSYLQ